MTILSVFQGACAVIGLKIPTLVYGSTVRECVELGVLANEMAQRIAFETHDWQLLTATATITGDGTSADFALPTDYKRMLKKARLWPSTTPYTVFTHYPDPDLWLGISVQSFVPIIGAWTMLGNRIAIKPTLANAATVKYVYLKNAIVTPTSPNTDATQFQNDADNFLLNERVLKLGIIWQWRANKGLLYSEDMENYESALAAVIAADRGSNILRMGGRRPVYGDTYAFPGTIIPP